MADQVIVDRMGLLLAAIVLPLYRLTLWAVDGSLSPIDEKLQTWTVFEYRFKSVGVAFGQLLLVAKRLIEHLSQTMHPLVGLRLTNAEQKALYCLGGVLPEVEQDEQEFVACLSQVRFATCPIAPVAGLVDELALDVVLPGILEAGEKCLKLGLAQSCQAFEDMGFTLNLSISEHGRFPTSLS